MKYIFLGYFDGLLWTVAMSVSSDMCEIILLTSNISNKLLVKFGMNIGYDIISSMSITLILAYVNTSISMFLIFLIFLNGVK